MKTKYSPVDPYFFDVIERLRNENVVIKIHFFGSENELNEANGAIKGVIMNENLKLN